MIKTSTRRITRRKDKITLFYFFAHLLFFVEHYLVAIPDHAMHDPIARVFPITLIAKAVVVVIGNASIFEMCLYHITLTHGLT
jgi:hypothetical protein